ncbi:MAG: hypothetical protein ABIK09_16530 [Pseudomonadota bacterium]
MRNRHLLVILAVFFLANCGGETTGPRYAGIESKGFKTPETTPEGQGLGTKLETIKGRKPTAVKDEAPPVPAETKFYRLTQAFEGSGYLHAALKHEVKEEDVAGKVPYVRVSYYDKMPEVAFIHDSFDNATNRVQYVWNDKSEIIAAEYQNRAGAMLKKYLFCPQGENRIDVHELNSFRVHKGYTNRVALTDTKISVTYVDGHDEKGVLPLWPDCVQLDPITQTARGFESPWGTAKMEFLFSEKGELLVAARYNAAGQLDSDYEGISKRELKWDENGQLVEEVVFDNAEQSYHVVYTRKDGLIAERKILGPDGKNQADYLGVALYGYTYDKRGRVATETHTDPDGKVLGTIEFKYNRKGYITQETHLDAGGKATRTFVHKYQKKGLRTEYEVYDGAAEDGKLALDENRVAVYHWSYDKEGELVEISHNGPEASKLVNDLTGVAKITWGEDREDKNHRQKFEHTSTVDAAGNIVKQKRFIVFIDTLKNEETGEEQDDTRTETWTFRWDYVDGQKTGGTETQLDASDQPALVRTVDADQKVLSVVKLDWSGDGHLTDKAWFDATGDVKAVNENGAHRTTWTYNSYGKVSDEIWTDLADAAIMTRIYEYDEEGKLTKTTATDAEGKPFVPAAL